MDLTGSDVVMIGRAACGNPWIFSMGNGAGDRGVEDFKSYYVGEASLLEDYPDGGEDRKTVSPDAITLPFEKDKEV